MIPPLGTLPPRRSDCGSSLPPDFLSPGEAPHLMGDFEHWFFTEMVSLHLVQTPSCRTTPRRLSAAAYSIYSELPSILEAVPPSVTRGGAMPWGQGPTFIAIHNTAVNVRKKIILATTTNTKQITLL